MVIIMSCVVQISFTLVRLPVSDLARIKTKYYGTKVFKQKTYQGLYL